MACSAFLCIGIPKDSILKYELALKANSFLLAAHGTADEVAKAKDILQTARPWKLDVHPAQPVKKATAVKSFGALGLQDFLISWTRFV